ncbi:MAG: MMPL family transporter, partial [Candidatus Rokubacteria bacterium]|nr:MMPL family transporter [Candidatus Rokubacteria bacterium]
MFAAWGRFVHRYRWPILVLAALSLLPSAWLVARGGRFDNNPLPRGTESRRALDLITRELPRRPASFGLILSSASLDAGAPAFREAVERALAPLRSDPRVVRLRTPWDGETPSAQSVSRDGRRVLVTVELRGGAAAAVALGAGENGEYADLRARVHSDALAVLPVGDLALNHDFTETARRAIGRAERVIWPVVPLLLV